MKMDWRRDQPTAPGVQREIRRVTLIGNFPPRKCGIATFTEGVHDALKASFPDAHIDVVAMLDKDAEYDFPAPVSATIRQDDINAYRAAATTIASWNPDVICVQHEFGIFGGPAGAYLLDLLDRVDAPVVTTLHTVLSDPNESQRRVMMGLAQRSSKLIVMSERGVDILRDTYAIPTHRIAVVPHGVPDRPLTDNAPFKEALGLAGRDLLFTFGLLSPNKGIEHMIDALPRIVAAQPNTTYLVLGATHPHLVAQEGEAYRERLIAQAADRGVSDNVMFVDRYADDEMLFDHLAAADLYVTPYLHREQITSGTLSFAVALGRPVLSTPYWHAEDLIAEGCGVAVPFADADALAREAIALLSDDERRRTISERAYAVGRTMLWSRLAQNYMRIFRQATEKPDKIVRLRHPVPRELPKLAYGGLERLTDDCGIAQHGIFALPDRNHGYCIDDNARALMAVSEIAALRELDEPLMKLARTYAAFVHHAWDDGLGTFRNFMGYGRNWLEAEGSEDSIARGFWAIASIAESRLPSDIKLWARWLTRRVLPRIAVLSAPRSRMLALLGLVEILKGQPNDTAALTIARATANHLRDMLAEASEPEWHWFEHHLTYDNARFCEAMIRAGEALDEPRYTEIGLSTLRWLCRTQTGIDGCFRPVGTEGFGRPRVAPAPFDQQPVEASATIDACIAAHRVEPGQGWAEEARRAYNWFLGANDHGISVAIPQEGDCHDGLVPEGVNLNQGAESVIAFIRSTCAMHLLRQSGAPAGGVEVTKAEGLLGAY